MWRPPQREGFIELEQGFARLLKNENGTVWESKVVKAQDLSLYDEIKKAIPEFFQKGTKINFICTDTGGFQLIQFPEELKSQDILNNLRINKKELFNTTEDLLFKTSEQPCEDGTRKVAVSYVPKATTLEIEKIMVDKNYPLAKITTNLDALLGAFERTIEQPAGNCDLVIHIGYSRVHLLAIKGHRIVQQRSLLTGSLRELENILFSAYSIVKEDAWLMLRSMHQQPVQVIEDTITNNRLDLLARIGGFIAELRGNKLVSETSKIFVSYSLIEEVNFTAMLFDRFGLETLKLTGMVMDERGEDHNDEAAAWLSGAHMPIAKNVTETLHSKAFQIKANPRLVIMCALVFSLTPLIMLRLANARLDIHINAIKSKYSMVENLRDEIKKAGEDQAKVLASSGIVRVELEKRGYITKITRHITETLPETARLETLDLNVKDRKITLSGFTVDTETALKYLDRLKDHPELGKPDIQVDTNDPVRVRFTINIPIGKSPFGKKGK